MTSRSDIHGVTVKTVSAMLMGAMAAGCFSPISRMDRSKLQIGTYCLATYARTEEQVKAVKDCGVDFIYGIPAADRATLDHCAKYGLGVIATGAVPFWHGSNDRGKMKEQRPLSSYSKAMAEYVDHPAIWMIDYIDESSAVDFPHIGAVTELLKTEVPAGVGLYANLYPTYASVVGNSSDRTRSQLGTATYDEHVAEFVRLVHLDYLSFDFYLYSAVGAARVAKLADFHRNFSILAEACRTHGKSLWYIPQVNSYLPDMWISENQLRFQANLALAYGAEVINWACWSREEIEEPIETPGLIGWWTNNVLTLTGERTQQYGKLKKINAELHRLGDRYMAYRNVGTRRIDDDAFVVGDMVARDGSGRKALFVLAAGDPFDEHPCRQCFTFAAASARAFGGNGEIPLVRNGDGTFVLELDANAGALVEYVEALQPVRPGRPGERPFWNANAEWFMYAPAFDFRETAGAANYRFRVLDDCHVSREFVTAKPYDSLQPVWAELPTGFATVTCFALDSKGEAIGLAGERTFWKSAPFRGGYPKAKRPHADAVRMGLEYLLDRKANRYFLENGKPDPSYDLNCYPAKMHAATIRAMCDYLKLGLPRKDEALKLARLCADYLIRIAEPEGCPLAGWPHTYEGTANTAAEYAGQQMLVYPAAVGNAYLSLYETAKDARYLAEARRIAATYLKLQGEDGTWYLKLHEKDGQPVSGNRLMPNGVIDFLERLYGMTGEERYRAAADRAFAYIDRGPLESWNWEGQFEDVPPSEPYFNLTKHFACDTAIYLLKRFPKDARRVQQAEEILRWAEDQFIAWEVPARKDGIGFRNRPGFKSRWAYAWQHKYSIWHCPAVVEQYSWYQPIDASAAKLIRTYLAYYAATGDALAFEKAKTLGDAVVNNQRDDGLSPTGWFGNYDEYHNWINCHIAAMQALQELCAIEKSAKAEVKADCSIAKFDPLMAARSSDADENGIKWIDGRDLPLEGRAFDDTEHYYDRLPANVTTNVNEGVRSMKHHTSGMVFRFKTDSKQLTFKWVPYSSSLEMDHMPSTGVSGIDVYRYDAKADRWRYVKTGRIGSASGATLTVPWEPGTPCLVNLPLYNGIRSFSLGVDRMAQVQALPPRKSGVEKPVVFYGTSITHGGCCSRPGMSFVNILGRTCDVPVVNLGFSGSGRMEYEMSEHLARIDASCYVLDCTWNMKSRAAGDPPGFTVEENFEPFVRNLRAKRPDVPIVIAESCDVYFGASPRSPHHQAKDRFVRGVYEKLIAEGWKRLYWLPKDEMYSGDFEGTVDGAHPNDAGMLTLATAYGKAVRAALAESGFSRQTTGKTRR